MSEPIVGCWILAAARGDEGSYQKVLQGMRHTIESGSQRIFPCNCQPRCPQPTEEQMKVLDRRLQADLYRTQNEHDAGDQ
jgi:hypothetical protein